MDAPLLDVNFYDYDGWRCYSYAKEDFLALTAMPEQPQNEGFIAQGWNWTLEQAQAHVRKYRYLEVGAYCSTADGKTRLYISVPYDGYTLVQLALTPTGLTADWGDGTTSVLTNVIWNAHTYVKAGNYVITIDNPNGTISLGYGSIHSILGRNAADYEDRNQLLTHVELGANVAVICDNAFTCCRNLVSINIPLGVQGRSSEGFTGTFNQCSSLRYFTVPQANESNPLVTSLKFIAQDCYSLKSAPIPYGYTSIPNASAFANCRSLRRINLPASLDTIGNNTANSAYGLGSEVHIPVGVTSIGSLAFANTYCVRAFYLHPTTPPSIQANTFNGIVDSCVFYVPHGCLEAYQTATNWAAYASRMVEMEEEI